MDFRSNPQQQPRLSATDFASMPQMRVSASDFNSNSNNAGPFVPWLDFGMQATSSAEAVAVTAPLSGAVVAVPANQPAPAGSVAIMMPSFSQPAAWQPIGAQTSSSAAPPPQLLVSPPREIQVQQQRPPFGQLHRFHEESEKFGFLSPDSRHFTKQRSKGQLTVVTEDTVHYSGVQRYALQFTQGGLSCADGIGFIFSPTLPCPKNIQKIASIFANSHGCICLRAHKELIRSKSTVKPLQTGDWVVVTVNLEEQFVEFAVWPASGGPPSTECLSYGDAMETMMASQPDLPKADCGYFACVVKHVGVTATLGS